jgi:hypothetical protein
MSSFGNIQVISKQDQYVLYMINMLSLIPLELFAFGGGYKHYYLLRCTKCLRFLLGKKYWSSVVKCLDAVGIDISNGYDRVILLGLTQLVICHVVGCLYFHVAIASVSVGETKNWLFHDNNIALNDDGSIEYLKDFNYLYLRSLYFAVQTVVRLTTTD